ESDHMARTAGMDAKGSPYAAGKEKPNGSDDGTTPEMKRLSPMNHNGCVTVNRIIASSRLAIRSQGRMESRVTRPNATKLIRTARPNKGRLFICLRLLD